MSQFTFISADPSLLLIIESHLILKIGGKIQYNNMSFDNIETILKKQKLSQYIQSILINDKTKRQILPSPKIVQVVTANSVSDCIYDYPCQFTSQRFKKGSYLKMSKWQINPHNYELTIHEAQYLGGAGSEVHHGKPWDHEKLHYIINAKIFSKYFVIFHPPTKGLELTQLPEFNLANLQKACRKEVKSRNKEEDKMDEEWPLKRRIESQPQASQKRRF